MPENNPIPIHYLDESNLNGLGKMMGQYLEQNLRDFEIKRRQARRLYICTSVEVEKGIATTIRFQKTAIRVEDGIAPDTDLHLKGSYLQLADLLSGKANPITEVVKGNIKILKIPITKPLQSLRLFKFLKIPRELIINSPGR